MFSFELVDRDLLDQLFTPRGTSEATEVDPMAMPGKQVACVRGPPDRLWEGRSAKDPLGTLKKGMV